MYEEEKFNNELSNVTIDSLQRELELKSSPRNKVYFLLLINSMKEIDMEFLDEDMRSPRDSKRTQSQVSLPYHECNWEVPSIGPSRDVNSEEHSEFSKLKREHALLLQQLSEEKKNNESGSKFTFSSIYKPVFETQKTLELERSKYLELSKKIQEFEAERKALTGEINDLKKKLEGNSNLPPS